MSAREILDNIKKLPPEDWLRIQSEVAEMLASVLSDEEKTEASLALRESEGDYAARRVATSAEVREHFGL